MKAIRIAVAGMLALAVVQSLHAQGQGTWTVTGKMQTPREENGQALLNSGSVLAMGGMNVNLQTIASSEIFSPTSETWAHTGSMRSARITFPAVRLNDGKVLVEGGFGNGTAILASAELFNPATGTWSPAGSLSVARYAHTATLLPDGDVLVTGGCTASACIPATAVSEIYHEATNTWSVTGSLNATRGEHGAVLLHSGQVMVVGGVTGGNLATPTSEIYTPSTGKWTLAASTNAVHRYGATTVLGDGKVLLSGGVTGIGFPFKHALNSAELYDPVHNTWTSTGNMATARYQHSSTLLPDGTALIAGGAIAQVGCTTNCIFAPTPTAEIFDESMGTFSSTSSLNRAVYDHSATTLSNGNVLVNGGWGDISYCCQPVGDSEFYSIP